MKRYAVVFEKTPNNWAAYVPDLPGCVTTGNTLDDTRRLIAEAIEFHIEKACACTAKPFQSQPRSPSPLRSKPHSPGALADSPALR
jgi:predicted RNase H-like HicB family nuclease